MTSSVPARVAPPILGEVVVRLGDRVLDVRHIGQRPEPLLSRAGLWTLAACVASLGLWLVGAGLAAISPDPPASGGAAGLGALLILLGVIPAAIAAGRPRTVPEDRYMIGEGPGVDLPVSLPAGLERAGVPLLLALERQLVLGLVPGMNGQIHHQGQPIALAELIAQGRRSYALPAGARCEATLGPLHFEIQAVEPEAQLPAARPLDRLYWASNLGALTVLAALLWLGEPPLPGQLELEQRTLHRARVVQYFRDITPTPPPPRPPPPPPPPAPVFKASPQNPARAPAAPPPALPELAVIGPDVAAPLAPRGARRGGRKDHDIRYTLLADEGVDSVLGRNIADVQESVLAFRDSAEDRKMWSDVLAAPVIARPHGGLELAETERGGGVHHDRPRPAKPPGKTLTIDMGAPVKGPSAEQRALARRVVNIEFQTPNVRGRMDPVTVLTEVRQQKGGLQRCFKEAVGTSERVGTIFLRLQVNGSGRVKQARLDFGGQQLGDIGPCVTAAARGWRFSPPLDDQPALIILEALFSARSY